MTNPILRPGASCWKVTKADRAAVLFDGAAYFQALRRALLNARRSVTIIGWDIDSRTPLVGPSGEPEDGGARTLGPFLADLVARRPELRINLLLWDYSIVYALEREAFPSISLDWTTPEQIQVCLDDELPLGASHHQKLVVVDDTVAFCGGLDLTIRRWDTPDHDIANPLRKDPAGDPYRPFHDMQMLVDGEAAAALAEIVQERWQAAACERLPPVSGVGDPWPEGIEPDFTGASIGIARTLPKFDRRPAVREVEALYQRSIDAAETAIYIENQFLTSLPVADRLASRLRERPELEALLVGPNVHQSWLEENSMNVGRCRFMQRLANAGVEDRVMLVHPALPDDPTGEGAMVHAKAMIVDDRLLRIGSSNLNNRSMGTDTECDLALEASDDREARTIVGIRNRLLAEHLGTDPECVGKAVEQHGSLLRAVEALSNGPRRLEPIRLPDLGGNSELADVVSAVADPERPVDLSDIVGDQFGGSEAKRSLGRMAKLALAAAAAVAVGLLWAFTPLSALARPEEFRALLEGLEDSVWMPIAVPAVFVLAGLVAFPITALIAGTGLLFDPLPALAYTITGTLLSASATYLVGHLAGRALLRRFFRTRINAISRAFAKRGVLSVAALRMVPVAPFTLINLVAGASHIRFADYLAGTVIGMGPGLVVMVLFGRQLGEAIGDPGPAKVALLLAVAAAWLGLSFALQALATRLRRSDV